MAMPWRELKNKVAARNFVRGYAERSGVTVEELYAHGRVVAECPADLCNYDECDGFQLIPRDDAEWRRLRIYLPEDPA